MSVRGVGVFVGYAIAMLSVVLVVLHVFYTHYRDAKRYGSVRPEQVRLIELLQSGQVLRGSTSLPEGQRRVIYTVKLSYRNRYYYYELRKDGALLHCLAHKDFSLLAKEVEEEGILQLDELDLPY